MGAYDDFKGSEEEKDWKRSSITALVIAGLGIWLLVWASHPTPSPDTTQVQADTGHQVESLSSNWLLAKQATRHDETMQSLTEAKQRGDMEALRRILRVRSAELAQVIDGVNSGSYSISDKQKMLVPLQQEKDWADTSILALSQ